MYACQRARDLVIVIVYNNGEAVVRVVTVGNNLVSNGFSVKYLQVLANIRIYKSTSCVYVYKTVRSVF